MKTHTIDGRYDSAANQPTVTGALKSKARRASRKTASVAGKAAGAVGSALGDAADTVRAAGRNVRERIDAAAEERYWREQYRREPYYDATLTFDDYLPACRAGYGAYERYPDRRFDEVSNELRTEYDAGRGNGRLAWERAKDAARAAWDRVAEGAENLIPGDSDGDGR
jgi:hypothetical protein